VPRGFVDCHTHVVPSGDDGAQSLAEGIELCELAAKTGTEVLYATPHVSPLLPLTHRREQTIRAAFDELRERVPVELRLGYELTPMPSLLQESPERYRLEGTELVLVEVPFLGPPGELLAVAEHIEAAGLVPLIAHPERTEAVRSDRSLPERLSERGWQLQVNGSSILGRHGEEAESIGWELIELGLASIVASDGHRLMRPARLDEAYELVKERVGEEAALELFDGTVLRNARPIPSRAAAPGA
jgi:protein-tyrosine phosphatase